MSIQTLLLNSDHSVKLKKIKRQQKIQNAPLHEG